MNIEVLSKKTICSNDDSIHNYFAWPTVARLHDGRLAMTASGFRVSHVCPFGKGIISYSEDEGETWTRPAVVIDTLLDDRDAGIAVFGENDIIVTSFTQSLEDSRSASGLYNKSYATYINSYLDQVEKHDWQKYLGATCRISHDDGKTFGKVMRIPVNTPHGPAAMPDGSLLYVGTKFPLERHANFEAVNVKMHCYRMFTDGTYEFLSEIDHVVDGFTGWEPHAIVLEDGKVIVHIREQKGQDVSSVVLYQCESYDGGKSFTKPHRLPVEQGGAPAHLIDHNGTLISTYGYRRKPYGIRAMFSHDEGKSWNTDNVILQGEVSGDFGYPSSVALKDGSILTVYYTHPDENSPAVIEQIIWRYSEE